MEKRLKLALPGAARECQTTSDALCLYFVRLENINIPVLIFILETLEYDFGALDRCYPQDFRFSCI